MRQRWVDGQNHPIKRQFCIIYRWSQIKNSVGFFISWNGTKNTISISVERTAIVFSCHEFHLWVEKQAEENRPHTKSFFCNIVYELVVYLEVKSARLIHFVNSFQVFLLISVLVSFQLSKQNHTKLVKMQWQRIIGVLFYFHSFFLLYKTAFIGFLYWKNFSW